MFLMHCTSLYTSEMCVCFWPQHSGMPYLKRGEESGWRVGDEGRGVWWVKGEESGGWRGRSVVGEGREVQGMKEKYGG